MLVVQEDPKEGGMVEGDHKEEEGVLTPYLIQQSAVLTLPLALTRMATTCAKCMGMEIGLLVTHVMLVPRGLCSCSSWWKPKWFCNSCEA